MYVFKKMPCRCQQYALRISQLTTELAETCYYPDKILKKRRLHRQLVGNRVKISDKIFYGK